MNIETLEKAKALYDAKKYVHRLNKILQTNDISDIYKRLVSTVIENTNKSIKEFQKDFFKEIEQCC